MILFLNINSTDFTVNMWIKHSFLLCFSLSFRDVVIKAFGKKWKMIVDIYIIVLF